MSNRMKAAAIAALMALSVAGMTVPGMMTASLQADAVEITDCDDLIPSKRSGVAGSETYKGATCAIASSGIETITFTVLPDYTGSFSWGFGINTNDDPDYWAEVAEGEVKSVEEDVPFEVTIDVSDINVQYNPVGSQWESHYEFRNYYSGADGSVKVIAAVANSGETEEPTGASEDPTDVPSDTALPYDVEADGGVYLGYTADLAESGIKNITITFTANFTGSVAVGFGIGLAKDPYWNEYDANDGFKEGGEGATIAAKTLNVVEGEEYVVKYDTSKLTLSYNPSTDQYPGKFEFRNYSKDGSITVTAVEANSTKQESETGAAEDPNAHANHDGWKSANRTSGSWGFTDNGDGTGEIWSTQARQVEFPDEPLTLTKGYDDDYYLLNEERHAIEGEDLINSHKFSFINDFGLGDVGGTQTIESLTATIQSATDVAAFMYGGGVNVTSGSPADTETAKALKGQTIDPKAGYWYNDMGYDTYEAMVDAGVEFGVTPGYGYYLTSEDGQLGGYFSVVWDVPEEVQPYVTPGDVSFQYWYGTDNAEEPAEIEAVDLVGGAVTYTETRTIDYTGSKVVDVAKSLTAGDDSTNSINLSIADDLGIKANQDVQALVFTLDTGSALDKLVYGIGASVGDDFKMFSDAEAGDNWNFVVLNADSETVEIAWIVPATADLNEEYGNILFGYWYGDAAGKQADTINLKSVEVFYAEVEEPTEEPTQAPTEPLKVTLWGDADVDGDCDIIDVICVNKDQLGSFTLTAQGVVNADVDQNNVMTFSDGVNILKSLVDLVTLPVSGS
ncbi:MAG: DUF5620 domain-containing protein [Oscillospiraceae bacterium]|nr:DUF5620 domain-containing protein [Oscillospiraceae bacterium]